MANRMVDPDTVAAGTLPVLATPFTVDGGAVDGASLRRLVDYAADACADGLVYPGVASEVGQLTFEERTDALETVAGAWARPGRWSWPLRPSGATAIA